MQQPLSQWLQQSPYQAYSYSYPHKSAYRVFQQPQSLPHVWSEEDTKALFLYVHIPFCEMRCGFCNLFTLSRPRAVLQQEYVNALLRQIRSIAPVFEKAQFARFAMGGGTPTYLSVEQLDQVLSVVNALPGMDTQAIPVSVEVSPLTATREKLALLRDFGIDRISMGVQSFDDAEVGLLVRKQSRAQVATALENIRLWNFPVVNLDLIYGIAGQTPKSWLVSLQKTLEFQPEEIYLYPLYVRPLTGLNRMESQLGKVLTIQDQRQELYRLGRDYLLANGYEQLSMRMFRLRHTVAGNGPVYCCQEDGMLGLGSGARSYTRALHYSGEYAVGREPIKKIIDGYCDKSEQQFLQVDYGIRLSLEEQKRRYLIQSLLLLEGLNTSAYFRRFQSAVWQDFACLSELLHLSLAQKQNGRVTLTAKGIAHSDSIGPWLASAQVRQKMQSFALR
ncbi:MAG: STM4012 family radical SAM protein [Gammaproteobacteria bacterium]|nr:STM4012 family radical SAM protein [Gammaproteobacteria bacterium]MDH5803107.1 STM4012 family radical SAM protein [Gammaproteobacteria bacterium]